MVSGMGKTEGRLTEEEVTRILGEELPGWDLEEKRVLVLIPDNTRSGPVDLFFRQLYAILGDQVEALDYLIALGTHPPLPREEMLGRVGVSERALTEQYPKVQLYNHRWDKEETLTTAGVIPEAEVAELSRGMLTRDVPVRVNTMIYDYDQIIICGPVFPHEVVGFSGGNKYFFPGISGQEVIDITHWLGALMTSNAVIGTRDTPVRDMIDRAVDEIDVPAKAICFVTIEDTLYGVYAGETREAWSRAADLSAEVHVTYKEQPYRQVLAVMPEMYDDLWTGAKGMYKTEPIVADGGEVIIYAPHITEFSYTHGETIEEVGFHVRDYFVKQWEKYREYPWGILAHSTHVRGGGNYDPATGVEEHRIQVTLATGISEDRCRKAGLGYKDPATISPGEWESREDDGVLVVPHAGEQLYRLRE